MVFSAALGCYSMDVGLTIKSREVEFLCNEKRKGKAFVAFELREDMYIVYFQWRMEHM